MITKISQIIQISNVDINKKLSFDNFYYTKIIFSFSFSLKDLISNLSKS